jgi:ATP-dependent Clp protease ATP-binding subunit ClpA
MEILQARKERLERHHNVLISEEALRASVKLTDLYVKDRLRPDKAIDAIDEACAHMQAITEYTPRTEELIRDRISLLKQEAKAEREEAQREREAVRTENPNAFERFGAELEALFIGMPEPVAANGEKPTAEPVRVTPRPATLAPVEAALARQLMEEGIVVRGHDVTRVVGLMSGLVLDWETESAR